MKKSENEVRRHRLYPDHKSDEFGYLHNEDPFFNILWHQRMQKNYCTVQSDQEFIDWKNKKIPILKMLPHHMGRKALRTLRLFFGFS